MAWTGGLGVAALLSWLKQLTGSWRLLFLAPAAMRIGVTAYWWRNCRTTSIRDYLDSQREEETEEEEEEEEEEEV